MTSVPPQLVHEVEPVLELGCGKRSLSTSRLAFGWRSGTSRAGTKTEARIRDSSQGTGMEVSVTADHRSAAAVQAVLCLAAVRQVRLDGFVPGDGCRWP